MTTLKRYTGTAWENIGLPVDVGMSPQTLGYAERPAGVAINTTELDIVAVTVTVPAGRRIRITGIASVFWGQSAAMTATLRIKEGATIIHRTDVSVDTTSNSGGNIIAILSPSAGTHTYRFTVQTSTGTANISSAAGEYSAILVEDITGSTLPYQPASVPVGQLAYAQVTASQGTFTAETDLTGLSVNVAVSAGRVLRITGHCEISSSVADGTMRLSIFEGATLVNMDEQNGTTNAQGLNVSAVISPSAGSHTYKLSGLRSAGTGNLTMAAGATFPAYILVEDITPTPAPSSGAPGSTLGYAELETAQTAIGTSFTDVTNLTTTITVPAGRRIRVTGFGLVQKRGSASTAYFIIDEGGTILAESIINAGVDEFVTPNTSAILSPAAGSHTYKVRARAGAGTLDVIGDPVAPAYILVEDITGSVWPEGSEVTAGMVASEAWTDYVPVNINITLGNGTQTAKYQRIGRTIHFMWRLVFGSTTAFTGGPSAGLPLPTATGRWLGTAFALDSGTQDYCWGITISGTTASVRRDSGGGIGATIPFTWAVNDVLDMSGTYEAAS